MCNSIAIQNFKRNFEFSATKRCLALTSNLWTLKIGTHVVQRVLNRYNAAIFDITLTALVMRLIANDDFQSQIVNLIE